MSTIPASKLMMKMIIIIKFHLSNPLVMIIRIMVKLKLWRCNCCSLKPFSSLTSALWNHHWPQENMNFWNFVRMTYFQTFAPKPVWSASNFSFGKPSNRLAGEGIDWLPTGSLSGVQRSTAPPHRGFLVQTLLFSGSKWRVLYMEAFSVLVEKPELAPVIAQDMCLSNLWQISSGDKDHNYKFFFLHTLIQAKK